jgi:hypothetical protein
MPFVSPSYLESVSVEKRLHYQYANARLGTHPETGDICFLPDRDRYTGVYVLGVQGSGKSGLLQNLIAHDVAIGNAVIVIDPHGDLVTDCIAQLDTGRVVQTYLLDMEDEGFPFGINVFSTGRLDTSIAQAQAVDRLMHIFEVLWADVLSQANLPRYVRAATITLLANPGATLVDMYDFLLSEQTRRRMVKNVTDPTVRQFWQTQYEELSPAEQMRRTQPLIGRLESLFMGRSLVRNVVGQRKTTINFRRAIENREIIFIKLPVKTVAQDARLIGTILMSQIHAAVFSFGDQPAEKRIGVSVYADEFQHWATPDFSEFFSEGRKYGSRVVVAHQYRSQLPGFLQSSTITAGTKVCFQVTPEDGRELSHLFPAPEDEIKLEDIDTNATSQLLAYGSDEPVVRQFIDTYLRPLQGQRRGARVEITNGGFSWRDTAVGMMSGGNTQLPRVADPTPYLDNLLYEVMRTGNGRLPIPREVPIGFSNCGYGFFPQARSLASGDVPLSFQTGFPKHLVVETANGLRWTRAPETGVEQFFHFIFHLRSTMLYLAEHRIGKKSSASASAVAQMLTQLPQRAAFVRTGNEVGVIYTDDTPPKVSDREYQHRLQQIREQTRAKYCHPREEIEQTFMPADTPTAPAPVEAEVVETPAPRWEED